MQIDFELQLEAADRAKLADIIGCDEAELAPRFADYSKAAAHEYVQMFLGRTAF